MSDRPGSTTWEYLLVALPSFGRGQLERGHSPAVEMLDAEGAEGWEAVAMSTLPDGSTAVLLKRPVMSTASR